MACKSCSMWWAAGVFFQQVIQDRWCGGCKAYRLIDFFEVSQRRWRPRCRQDFEKSLKHSWSLNMGVLDGNCNSGCLKAHFKE